MTTVAFPIVVALSVLLFLRATFSRKNTSWRSVADLYIALVLIPVMWIKSDSALTLLRALVVVLIQILIITDAWRRWPRRLP